MSRFVLDNTVTMAWCFDDEATPFTESVLSRLASLTDTAIVPTLWLYEVVNVIGLAARKGRIFVSVRALVGRYKLTAYDASYLELAIRHDLPIAALDNALTKAARDSGVALVT